MGRCPAHRFRTSAVAADSGNCHGGRRILEFARLCAHRREQDAADGAGISWLHRNAEVLDKKLHDGRYDMTVRVDETKRDIVASRFGAVPHGV